MIPVVRNMRALQKKKHSKETANHRCFGRNGQWMSGCLREKKILKDSHFIFILRGLLGNKLK